MKYVDPMYFKINLVSSKFSFRDDPALVDTALVNAASVNNDVYLWIYTIHTIKRHIVMI